MTYFDILPDQVGLVAERFRADITSCFASMLTVEYGPKPTDAEDAARWDKKVYDEYYPTDLFYRLIDEGTEIIDEACFCEETAHMVGEWRSFEDTPYDQLIEDAETSEERDEWAARAYMWDALLYPVAFDTVGKLVRQYEDMGLDSSGEWAKDWMF